MKTDAGELRLSFARFTNEQVSFRCTHERQLRYPLLRMGDHSFEQDFEMAKNLSDGHGLEAICFVAGVQSQLRTRHRCNRQAIVRLFDRTQAGDRRALTSCRK